MYAFAIYCREDGGGPGIGGRVESGYPDSFRASDGGRGHTASLCRYGAVAGLQHTAGIGRKREALPDRYSYYRRRGNRCRVGS